MNENAVRNREVFESPELVESDGVFIDQEAKIRLIEEEIRSAGPFERGLDAGCSTGLAGVRYRAAGIRHLTGADLSEAALAVAERRGFDDTRCWVIGSEPAPFEADEFDIVVLGDVIEHLVNTEFAVAEIRRILRPQGRLIVTTPNLAYWWSRVRLLCGRPPVSIGGTSSRFRRDVRIDLNHIRLSVLTEWRAFFESMGFQVEHTRGWSLGHYPMKHRAVIGAISGFIDRILTMRPTWAFGLFLSMYKLPDALDE
jgi:SAM-dependent methyltransferase